MKAIIIEKIGGPEVLVDQETKMPAPKAGEALVKLEAIVLPNSQYRPPATTVLGFRMIQCSGRDSALDLLWRLWDSFNSEIR